MREPDVEQRGRSRKERHADARFGVYVVGRRRRDNVTSAILAQSVGEKELSLIEVSVH
ncbi:hypothetical protein J32TS6_02980 [Virgibacillus pantothenticus]|nr:hypothetical protein J32TS6_02980 [Virgibacillus pantothenticus]